MANSVEFRQDSYTVTITHEQGYTPGSADNVHTFDKEYLLDSGPFVSMHAIRCAAASGDDHSCILAANGGSTTVHAHSAIVREGRLYVAICDKVCCLSLPDLQMMWHVPADGATCFELYELENKQGLIVHGELSISRLSYSGDILWSAGGKDIFTEGFKLLADVVEVEDFEHTQYRIDTKTGVSTIIT